MTIKGSDITVGTTLRWFVEYGQYYRATHEVTVTVESIFTDEHGRKCMMFVHEYPRRHVWFLDDNKDYETVSQNRVWLDGSPNNPL